MTTNSKYTIQLKEGNLMQPDTIERIKGISSVRYNQQEKNLSLTIDEKYADDAAEVLQEAVAQIRQSGSQVLTAKITQPVLNMTCAACASSSQNILSYLPGVVSASVNYGNGKGTIEYIPGIVSPTLMKHSLQEVGYDLLLEEEESTTAKVEEIEKEQYKKLRLHTFWSILLTIPLVIVGMFFMDAPYANLIMLILATPILFIFGRRFFVGAWKQARHRTANMDTLVALSTGIAYLFSLFNMLYPQFWENRGLMAHVYFEAAGVIITFILLGKMLEARAKGNTSDAIKKLMGLQPSTVVVFRDDKPMEIPIGEVQINDTILVKPGDKIAVDGEVIEGSSFIDESMITGEPIHVEKNPGKKVFAGTINQKGSFRFRAQKVGKDTLLAQIIKTVDEAQGSKAPVQGLVDKIAAIFVPVVIGLALLSFVAWIIFGVKRDLYMG